MKRYHIYRIYYGNEIVYVGRTKQLLIDRIRAHMTKGDPARINPLNVSLIEYADCNSEADMCLYEVYYINLLHPELNEDAKAEDNLTVELPELIWKEFVCSEQMAQWRGRERTRQISRRNREQTNSHYENLILGYEKRWRDGEIDRETYEALVKQITVLQNGNMR